MHPHSARHATTSVHTHTPPQRKDKAKADKSKSKAAKSKSKAAKKQKERSKVRPPHTQQHMPTRTRPQRQKADSGSRGTALSECESSHGEVSDSDDAVCLQSFGMNRPPVSEVTLRSATKAEFDRFVDRAAALGLIMVKEAWRYPDFINAKQLLTAVGVAVMSDQIAAAKKAGIKLEFARAATHRRRGEDRVCDAASVLYTKLSKAVSNATTNLQVAIRKFFGFPPRAPPAQQAAVARVLTTPLGLQELSTPRERVLALARSPPTPTPPL